MSMSQEGYSLLALCAPHLIEAAARSEWPGTGLLGHTATVYRYRLSPGMLDCLKAGSRRLYGWLQPTLPEDLAMYRPDDSVLLASIAHESDAWLKLHESEIIDAHRLPLRLAVRSREGRGGYAVSPPPPFGAVGFTHRET